jgi:hypothetical protein
MARLRSYLINSALVICSVLLTYFVLEFSFFRLFLPYMPLQLRPHLPDVADVLLTQNSKSAFLPHDYVALLGDSYAEGQGDWLLQTEGNRAKPYHSANVIHELTGRDVMSFGKGGAGSAEGIVERPAGVFSGDSCYLFPSIETPRQMFIYYYEGNDVEDNLNFETKVHQRYGRLDTHTIDHYLTEVYVVRHARDCHLELLNTASRMVKFLYEYYVSRADLLTCSVLGPRQANRLVVGNQIVPAPVLQGPALSVGDEAIQASMQVLDRSLIWLRHRFEGVPTTVVYIPSPLSVYHVAAEDVSYCFNNVGVSSAAKTERNSDFISNLVQKISANQGLGFLDARPTLRALAAKTVIHGPRDWNHLNETGYRALGSLVAAHVTGPLSIKLRIQ